jgi:hypothetical protein
MRILILGDSQAAGPPGQILEGLLEGLGHTVMRIGMSGQGALDWRRSHWGRYKDALASFRPDDVILVFGTNNRASAELELAMKAFSDSAPKVWYAGPPQYAEPSRQAIGSDVRLLAKRVFGWRYLDAWPYTGPAVPRRPDGVHFNPDGGRIWALGILERWGRGGTGSMAAAVIAAGLGIAALWWVSRR